MMEKTREEKPEKSKNAPLTQEESEQRFSDDDQVDESSQESFPASDPPAHSTKIPEEEIQHPGDPI